MTFTSSPSLTAVLMTGVKRTKWKTRRERGLPPAEHWLDEMLRRGHAAVDYRRSYANVWRRLEQGETPEVCAGCGCETDVTTPAHAARCDEA